MKHIVFTLFIYFFCLTVSNAQYGKNSKNNALSLELGKTGIVYNLNFDHKLSNKNFGVRAGVGSNFYKYLNLFTTGAGVYYLSGNRNNFFELGIDIFYLSVAEVSDDQKGASLSYPNYAIKTYYASANIGYRQYGKKTLFRTGFSPGIIKNKFLPGGYVSYGFTF